MQFKRPRLTKREEAAAPQSSTQAAAPQPARPSSKGISPRELQKALGSFTPAGVGGGGGRASTSGISTKDLGHALSKGQSAHGSVETTRVTSYPMDQDLNALPVKAGTRTGPRVTSYRIPLRKAAHNNVYDAIT